MWCVIIQAEIPIAIGPFRSEGKAETVADEWNSSHPDSGAFAVAELLMTVEQAEREL